MEVLEHFLCGKENKSDTCEDGLVIGKSMIAVIDGVTSKGTRLWDGKTSGCYARCVLADYLQKNVEKLGPVELLTNLDAILKEKICSQLDNIATVEYPRAAIIIYNDYYKQVWSYGDCQCRINEQIFTHSKKIDELNADLRAYHLEYLLSQGVDMKELQMNDVGRKEIQKNLLMQFAFENISNYFGYPVINGMGINESMIETYSVKSGDVVVLASDGYPVLKDSLNECEKELDYIIKNDPMCFRLYRSTKGIKKGNISFDDRTFCKFIV